VRGQEDTRDNSNHDKQANRHVKKRRVRGVSSVMASIEEGNKQKVQRKKGTESREEEYSNEKKVLD
jgi:hypothetical protein